MQRITISIDDPLLQDFDRYVETKGYTNRSEGMRDAVRQLLAVEQIEQDQDGKCVGCVGCVAYVYKHSERALSSKLVETQHHHHDIPPATLHLHLDADNCLEATVLRGTVAQVRNMADQITSQIGVKYGRLHIIPVDST